jgi:16S rRNA (adenine1518-N6/adenine1519-N6)-dimethyltransferase
MLTPTQLKTLLGSHGLRLTKRLGQHHLVDARVIERLLAKAALSPDDTVVEIGPGLGALTEPLAQRVRRVIAVEIDRGIAALLSERMRPHPNVEVICGDILTFAWPHGEPLTVIGAIPYHITSPILVSLCEQRRFITQAVLILQEELAQRLLAKPGTRAWGRLSVLVQYGWQLTSLCRVPSGAFFPRPRVDSRCVRLIPRPPPSGMAVDPSTPPARLASPNEAAGVAQDSATQASLCEAGRAGLHESQLFELTRRAFAHRRKTVVNCLSEAGTISRQEVEAALGAIGVPVAVRAQALSIERLIALANHLYGRMGHHMGERVRK